MKLELQRDGKGKMKKIFLILTISLFIFSCKSVDLEEQISQIKLDENEQQTDKETQNSNKDKIEKILTFDTSSSPEITYSTVREEKPDLIDGAALKQHLEDISVPPEYKDGRLKTWVYEKGKIYQLHTQPYRTTVIQLEPGEEILEEPFLSETQVWKLSRGVGYVDGVPCHFFMLKPDYSGIISSLVILTNKRVYQLEIESFKDHYMPYASWTYPKSIINGESYIKYLTLKQRKEKLTEENKLTSLKPENLSFNYVMKKQLFKTPVWLPTQVFDDGEKTYIILNEKSLHMTYPALFNEKDKLINYRTVNNIIIVDRLLTKFTLKLGKEKVRIYKKKSSKTEKSIEQVKSIQNTIKLDDGAPEKEE